MLGNQIVQLLKSQTWLSHQSCWCWAQLHRAACFGCYFWSSVGNLIGCQHHLYVKLCKKKGFKIPILAFHTEVSWCCSGSFSIRGNRYVIYLCLASIHCWYTSSLNVYKCLGNIAQVALSVSHRLISGRIEKHCKATVKRHYVSADLLQVSRLIAGKRQGALWV